MIGIIPRYSEFITGSTNGSSKVVGISRAARIAIILKNNGIKTRVKIFLIFIPYRPYMILRNQFTTPLS